MGSKGQNNYMLICKTNKELNQEKRELIKKEIITLKNKFKLENLTTKILSNRMILFFDLPKTVAIKDFAQELLIRTENLLKLKFHYKKVWENYRFQTLSDISENAVKKHLKNLDIK